MDMSAIRTRICARSNDLGQYKPHFLAALIKRYTTIQAGKPAWIAHRVDESRHWQLASDFESLKLLTTCTTSRQ
jgi:hypothetical protein